MDLFVPPVKDPDRHRTGPQQVEPDVRPVPPGRIGKVEHLILGQDVFSVGLEAGEAHQEQRIISDP